MNPDAASTTSAFPAPTPVLNGYRIVEPLGGLGSNVYKVRRESDQELFAAKVFTGLSPAVAQTLQLNCEQAFLLSHPRLVPVTGTGRSGDYFYILSEYTPGDSLAVCLERWRRLPYPQSLDMVTALAQAMAYAHMHGMHHGSLDPRKIMVLERINSQDEQLRIGPDRSPDSMALFDPVNVKIAGTGLGLPMSAFTPGDPRTLPVTRLPSQLYAAPERLVADLETAPPPTEWSDIYSLGCVFYQLLTGELPFPATDANALRLMHQSETASLEPLRALEVPDKAQALIGHMIDRDASVRPSTYDALLEALSQLHGEYHDKIARASAKPRRGGTSSIRLNPVREATALLAAPPLPESPYRTHFARRTARPWGKLLAVALLSSVATAGGIAAGMYLLRSNQAPATAQQPVPVAPTPLSGQAGRNPNGTAGAAESELEARAQIKYAEICELLEKVPDNDLPVAIAKLKEFKQTYNGTKAASRAEERCDFLEKKLALALAQKPQPVAPPVPPAADPRLPQWEQRRKQALELAAALHFDQALQRVDPKQLPPELQTTEIMKNAADAWADISADVGRHWAQTEQNVATLLVQKQYDAALLQVDLVIKTWGVDDYVQRAQQLRAKITASQEMETERLKSEGLEKQRSREAGDWAQQLYILNVQAKKFQYDQALTTAKSFRGLDLKNDVVRNEVDEEIEILTLQKE
ncbi:MAG TPA: protein kinase, partial [Planctomycetota bacterium]|nr:protein kinase [Planctomycetota bacterium]